MSTTLALVALLVSFAITAYTVRHKRVESAEEGTDWGRVVLFFGLMLLGMLAREGFNALVNQKTFNWTSLGIAAIISPIVFGGIYGSLGRLKVDVPTTILAFQNGFFWNTIFESIQIQ